ncbi:hypothetical protein SMACR_07826 [Sordaria macrospora]|uniref:WGS project CABT00000000 data, contig 2.14 n=2 Tax=Sordaria macrospora TaxID=5147 RepID=F7VZ62_SORMK|nr:uncharacterized protein SMAC_07826 [Sordaria macrospora k-hell]KAA8631590.1 hypothetical protein SMACR_07826 [Sordaria macrospora]KAH7633812.1 hypothetical protein B0T09DRAFT_355703 [Sordaria sp. MPI-SDFR-AT-0083]WPJ59818.1 hypothetical protein SMAC4_07826 [Sordaria macrospora]CCC10809.1 unnamed protein product [Sordaria macrospora k-hell]
MERTASYTITEPHPTVVQNTYTKAGRGGAGNFFKAPKTTPSSGVPTKVTPSAQPSAPGRFYSGRGGAGNAHTYTSRPTLSFDEEYQRAEVREKAATMGYVGRGGAGNIFSTVSDKISIRSEGSSRSRNRRDSISTTDSHRSGFWRTLSNLAHKG